MKEKESKMKRMGIFFVIIILLCLSFLLISCDIFFPPELPELPDEDPDVPRTWRPEGETITEPKVRQAPVTYPEKPEIPPQKEGERIIYYVPGTVEEAGDVRDLIPKVPKEEDDD